MKTLLLLSLFLIGCSEKAPQRKTITGIQKIIQNNSQNYSLLYSSNGQVESKQIIFNEQPKILLDAKKDEQMWISYDLYEWNPLVISARNAEIHIHEMVESNDSKFGDFNVELR